MDRRSELERLKSEAAAVQRDLEALCGDALAAAHGQSPAARTELATDMLAEVIDDLMQWQRDLERQVNHLAAGVAAEAAAAEAAVGRARAAREGV